MASDQPPSLGQRFFSILMIPWVDKTIAVLAVLPFIIKLLYDFLMQVQMNIPRTVVTIHLLVFIATMVFRSTPVRITPNPWYWLLAFVATYWGLFTAGFIQKGVALVPSVLTNSISIFSLVIAVYARLSLGRNIGLVPAQRDIVTGGAYRFVRHPIYTALFISYLSFALRMYTPLNLTRVIIGIGLFMLKSFVEEWFLRDDPAYAQYLTKVRWRWFPGLF